MKNRKTIQTTVTQIVNYWKEHLSDHMIGVEWEDAQEYCWRCACKCRLQRCHIIPDSLGGKDEPSNMVLLCETCHSEGPNVDDPEVMWDWISAYSVPFYDSFWIIQGMKEYEYIYGTPMEQDISDILALAGAGELSKEEIKKYIEKVMPHSSIHFGQIYPNAATMAGALRIMVKTIAKDYGVQFPMPSDELVF
jgi:hypothetical protein